MALGGGASCVKYLLFCFNLLFAITGLIIIIVGAKVESSAHPYVNFTDESFLTAPVVLIVVGVIVFIVAFFGCCGAVKENHCMIITFSVFLLIIFVAELAVGIAGYVKHRDLEEVISQRLNETLSKYSTDKEVQQAYDILQTDLQCCGINGADDWINNKMDIPETCCSAREITNNGTLPCKKDSPQLHKNGCLNQLVDFLKSKATIIGGVGIGIAFIQLLGVIFACCLARSIRREYETV